MALRYRNTVVGGKCALPSALLFFISEQLPPSIQHDWLSTTAFFPRETIIVLVITSLAD